MIHSLQEFFKIARISKVICVDDDNNNMEIDTQELAKIIRNIATEPQKYRDILEKADIDIDVLLEFGEEVEDRITFLNDYIDEDTIKESAVTIQDGSLLNNGNVSKIVQEWNSDNFIDDFKVIGSVSEAIEFLNAFPEEWQGNSENRILWLIDRDFSKADESKNAGFGLIQEIAKKELSEHICLLVTANTEDIATEELCRKVLSDMDMLECIYLASVVNKKNIIDSEKMIELLEQIITGLWSNYTFHLISRLSSAILSGAKKSEEKILNLSPSTMRHILVNYPEKEGSSVQDTIFRILNSLIAEQFGKYCVENITIFARLMKDYKTLEKQVNFQADDNEILYTLLRNEKYNEHVNALRQAVGFGDIFEIEKKSYILLSQPCDITYRNNEGRKVDKALLVRMKVVTESEREKKPKYYSEEIRYFSKENNYWLDFRDFRIVAFNILDLCVLSKDGKAKTSISNPVDYTLLPYDKPRIDIIISNTEKHYDYVSTMKELDTIKSKDIKHAKGALDIIKEQVLKDPSNKETIDSVIELLDLFRKSKVKQKEFLAQKEIKELLLLPYEDHGYIVYSVKRINRLNEIFSIKLYNEYTNYHSRIGLPGDFTSGITN